MMKDEKEGQIEGKLIIAVRKCTSIEVFAGPLIQLVSSRAELGLIEDQYHFNVVVQRDLMRCIQVPDVKLERILSFPHSDKDRERLRKRNEALKMMAKLSLDEFEELEERIEKKRLKHSGS